MEVREFAETPVSAVPPQVGYPADELAYLERARIFSSCWSYATAADRVSLPGSYAVVPVGDASVVLVRDPAGELRAFKNVCQHRGHEIASGAGRCRALKCPYHSWTYNLQGGLIAAPYMQEKLDFSTVRLSPAAIQTINGVIFVSLDADDSPVDGTLVAGAWLCDGLALTQTRDDAIAADWKPVVELLLERFREGAVSGDYVWPSHWWLRNATGGVVFVARVLPDGPGRSRLLVDRYATQGEDDVSFEPLSIGDRGALEHRQPSGGNWATSSEQVRQFRARVRQAVGDRDSEDAR